MLIILSDMLIGYTSLLVTQVSFLESYFNFVAE